MNKSAAIAGPMPRGTFGRRARSPNPQRTARVDIGSSWVRAPHGSSRNLQADRERRRIAVSHCRRSQHELITTMSEDPIMLVSRGARSCRGIRRVSMDTIRQHIVEVQLRRELKAPPGHGRGANLEVNMHCPARIPARVHGDKSSIDARVGYLIAT